MLQSVAVCQVRFTGFIMSIFSDRFKIIKKCYNMSADELSAVLIDASRQTVSAYENGTREPPLDALVSIAIKFAVSLDWLCGLSGNPYTDTSVDRAEAAYFEGSRWNMGHIDTNLFNSFDPFPPAYAEDALRNYGNPVTRRERYSLEARANILVLLRYPNAITLTSRMDNVNPDTEAHAGENKKKRKKYLQVISDLKTVINTGKALYVIEEQ